MEKMRKPLQDNTLHDLMMQAPVTFLYLTGPDFLIQFANRRILDFMGKTWEDLYCKPIFEVFPELNSQDYGSALKSAFNTGRSFTRHALPLNLILNKKVQSEFVNINVQPVENNDGIVTGLLVIGLNVTELVKSRAALAENEAKYREIVNSINQGFCIIEIMKDEQGNPVNYFFVEINPAFEKVSGLTNIIGKTAREVIPNNPEFWIEQYGEVARTGEPKLLTGEAGKWYEVFVFRIGDHNSNRVGLLFSDISERVKQELARDIFAEELKRQVDERTRELQRSNEDLMNFAHVASHDLKEPVRKIRTFLSMLYDELGSEISKNAKTYLEKIDISAERLKSMIDGVLNYSLLQKTGYEVSLVDLNEIIKSILFDLEVLIESKNARFEVPELPTIEGAKILLYQLFYNIINNALKFTKPNEPALIKISATIIPHHRVECVEITLSDNGIGFDPQYSEIIFETFSRLHSKDNYEGTGLGLALCKRIVERHYGTIRATGDPQTGASFHISLPMKQLRT